MKEEKQNKLFDFIAGAIIGFVIGLFFPAFLGVDGNEDAGLYYAITFTIAFLGGICGLAIGKQENNRRNNLTPQQREEEDKKNRIRSNINGGLNVGKVITGLKSGYTIYLVNHNLYLEYKGDEIIAISKDFVKNYEFVDSDKKISIEGSIVGGLIAGDAGAIIGSNTGTKEYLIAITWLNDKKSIIKLDKTGYMNFKLNF